MPLRPEVSSHHTVWVKDDWGTFAGVRYAVSGEQLVCFGDKGLSRISNGAAVSATIRAIANGDPLCTFPAHLRELRGEDITNEVMLELLEHVSLGHTLTEVAANLEKQRTGRRVVAIVP